MTWFMMPEYHLCSTINMSVTIFLLLLLGQTWGEITIVSSSPGNSSLVRAGEPGELSCTSDKPWFLCVWRSPGGDKQCAIQETGQGSTTSVCQGDPRIELHGGANFCSIRLRETSREDWGSWMCLLQDGEKFHADRKLLGLQVAQEGRLQLVAGGRRVEDGVLRLTEGETILLECRVEEAFPRPLFSWRGPSTLPVLEEDRHLYHEERHEYSSQSSVQYRATTNHTNTTISCVAEQFQQAGGTTRGPALPLYTLSGQVSLQVEPLPRPLPYSLSTTMGVLSGILLTVIFLLLVCVVTTAVMCRRQRREQASLADSSDYQTPDSLQPVWTSSRWPALSSASKKKQQLVSSAPSYSVVNLSSEGGGLQSTPTSNLSSSASILTDGSPTSRGLSLQPAPSLHETHFGDLLDQPPVTLLHPPGLMLTLPHRSASLLYGMSPRKVSSSQSEGFPCCASSNFGSRCTSHTSHCQSNPAYFRPVSSMGLSLVPEGPRDLQKLSVQTLPGLRPSSSSSLFDCPHECFAGPSQHNLLEEVEEERTLGDFARTVRLELEEARSYLDKM